MTGHFAIRKAGFIGFDHILNELEQISQHAMDHYPPHNIVKYTKKFKRQFRLSEHTEVHGATFEDGLLVIDLRVVVPDNKRPQKIKIR